MRAGQAEADRSVVKVETRVRVESIVTVSAKSVKVAAAWVGRIRHTADVGLAGSRGGSLARRRVDDRVIACRALIAPILAPRVAGCTRRRRGSAAIYAVHCTQTCAMQTSCLRARHSRGTLCVCTDKLAPLRACTHATLGKATAVRTHATPRHGYCAVPSGLNDGAAVGMRLGARVVGKRLGALVVGKRVGALVVGMATGATVVGAAVGVAANRSLVSCWHMGRMGGGARGVSGGVGART